ncbi:olfactory receptor 2K2-like [Tachyglossus aculeatus]|uniref:olfactory receptor 2K2-like n=1 Tax=Tachyglossus aculeatus TaxID=9261 RepID=UPI0018F4D9E2|nr:olfactory receptor 2K2-like [Tachyglossus aculeatus]
MKRENHTTWTFFFLEGFSSYPKLEIVLFAFSLVMYLITLLGNTIIISISILDSHLHTPMYFFLSNLSLMDICYTSSSIPTLLVNLLAAHKKIFFKECAVQMYFSLAMGSTECVLLAVMAYDRYVAICKPLRYPIIMNMRVCVLMATGSWITGFFIAVLESTSALRLPLCGNIIDHFTCEILAVLKLACAKSLLMDTIMFVTSVLLLPVPMLLITVSYIFILTSILKINSAEGRNKAFSTCGAHLTVVILFYGAALSMYLKPSSANSQETDKIISLLYGVLTPMLNPIIYSLRNKEVKNAVKKMLLGKMICLRRRDLQFFDPLQISEVTLFHFIAILKLPSLDILVDALNVTLSAEFDFLGPMSLC